MAILIINSKSGESHRDLPFWRNRLNASGLTDFEEIDFLDDNWPDVIQADTLVLAAGGDGTISAVAGACVKRQAVLAILPSGTANDFARSLGIDEDPEQACQIATNGPERLVDVGVVNDRIFINVLHIGLGAAASNKVDQAAKSNWGKLSYLRTLVDKLDSDKGFAATIHVDEQQLEGDWLEIGVANGLFYGGRHRVPGSKPDDGALNLFGVRPNHAVKLAAEYAKVQMMGPEDASSDLLEHYLFQHCLIETLSPQPVTADGEDVGYTPVEIKIRADSLRVRAPNDD